MKQKTRFLFSIINIDGGVRWSIVDYKFEYYSKPEHIKGVTTTPSFFRCKKNFVGIDAFLIDPIRSSIMLTQVTVNTKHPIKIKKDLEELLDEMRKTYPQYSFVFVWIVPDKIFPQFVEQKRENDLYDWALAKQFVFKLF